MKNYTQLYLTLIFFLCFYQISLAQSDFVPKFNVGYHQGGVYSDFQLGYIISSSGGGFLNFNDQVHLVSVGFENNYYFKNDFRFTPKASLEFYNKGFLWGFQTRLYPAKNMDFKQASLQVCPIVGISLFSLGHLSFGYNFGLTNRDITSDLGFQVNLGINIITNY